MAKPSAADGPDPFPADAVGEVAERDLPGNADQADEAQRPRRDGRAEADLHQVLGLVHLHRVPGVEGRRNSRARSTRTARVRMARPSVQSTAAQAGSTTLDGGGAAERSARHRRPGRSPMSSGRLRSSRLIGASTTSSSVPMAMQAARQPAPSITVCTQGSSDDGADADAGEGDADRQPAPAHEPVGQEQRLAGVAEAHAAAADQHAERQIEMPGLVRQRRQQQPGRHQADAELHHHARADPVHHAAEHRAQDRRHHEAERERARR